MKKIIISAVLIYMSINCANAQGIYFGFDGGYGFAAAKSAYQNTSQTNVNGAVFTTYTNKTYSYGKGINLGLYFGNMFSKHIGLELNANYLTGSKYTLTSGNIGSTNPETETMKGRMFRLTPAIKIVAGEKKIHPYLKAGFIIGLGTKIIEEDNSTQTVSQVTYTTEKTKEYTGGICYGFHGAIGINFMVDDMTSLFIFLQGDEASMA